MNSKTVYPPNERESMEQTKKTWQNEINAWKNMKWDCSIRPWKNGCGFVWASIILCLSRNQHEMRMFICNSATMPRCCFLLLLRGPFCRMHKKWKTNEILFAKPIVIIVLLFLSFTFAFSFIHNFGYCLIRFFPLSPALSVSIRLRLWLSFLCVTKCWNNCKSLEAANKLNHCMSCDRLYLIMNYNFPERTIFNNIHERNLLKQQNSKKNIHKYTREKR